MSGYFEKKAVALEYGSNEAPTVLAKGENDLADAIVAEAKSRGIHIAKDPNLVALLSRLELGEEIPEDLFVAVSVILSWVDWLKGLAPDDLD